MKGLNEPQQDRGERSIEWLGAASIDLMATGSVDEAPITEIIKKAQCSVGAFFGRFDGKDAQFRLVQDRVLDEATSWPDREFDKFLAPYENAREPIPTRRTSMLPNGGKGALASFRSR